MGEGFSLIDIIRNQQTVVRKAYPEGPIDYIYTDENGQTHTLKKKKTQGHRFFNFPDKSAFCPNSKYYFCTELRIRKSWRKKPLQGSS